VLVAGAAAAPEAVGVALALRSGLGAALRSEGLDVNCMMDLKRLRCCGYDCNWLHDGGNELTRAGKTATVATSSRERTEESGAGGCGGWGATGDGNHLEAARSLACCRS
jgi:hypothetical protein